jgi:phage terminase large subunit-like protein
MTVQPYRKTFTPNPAQDKVNALAWQDPYVENLLAYGPSRSGKSANFVQLIAARALAFPGTKHAIFRLTMRSCRAHLFNGTFPEIMNMLYPGYLDNKAVHVNRAESWVQFHNGSKIVFEGLDPNNIDKVLGAQYATAWVNECNEVQDYEVIQQLASRMADTAPMVDPSTGKVVLDPNGQMVMCRPLMLFDCNPDTKGDWDYLCFKAKQHPQSGKPFKDKKKWRSVFLPAHENADNLAKGYLDSLAERYDGSPNMASRFLEGQWRDDNPNALFRKSMFRYRECPPLDFFLRIVVAVDPSGGNGNQGDHTGICVVGLGSDGLAYILEDASIKGTPEQWSKEVGVMYDKWNADLIVAEKNYGGTMVENTIRQYRRNLPVKLVNATRGKLLRAEPVAMAYHQGKVFHIDTFKELEAQMCDYKEGTKKSPDRMDALVWGVTEVLKIGGPSGTITVNTNRGSIFR